MGLLKKRITRFFKDNEKERYEGGKLRSFCEKCGKDIKPSQENVCRFCRKSFCKDHLRAVEHKCKKRGTDPFRTWSGKGRVKIKSR